MNMTPTTASQICNRQYTDAAIAELQQIAATNAPSEREIVEAFAAFVALNPAATLYELFLTLRDEHGIDIADLVDCVLGEMMAASVW